MSTLKVLHIASGDLWAGAEKQLYTLLLALRQSTQIAPMAIILNPGTLADAIREAGIDVLVLDETRQNFLQLMLAVNRFVAIHEPDIIHTHRLKENIIGALVAARHRTPSLRTQHGANEHPFSPYNIRKRLLYDLDFLAGRLLQKKIIAVSDPLADALRSKFGSSRICVIDNGLDPAPSTSSPQHKFKDPLRIGMVGRLVPVKRVDIFLRIAQAVLTQQRLKASPVFQVIGDGPLRQSLENLAADLGIAEQVSFVGHVDNAEQHIAELDVLVLCSDHEGLPMVALEAMKTCTAVLTHPIGGLPRLLDGGRCGYLVASQQPALFVDAIATMLSDRQDMVIRTELARQRLLDHYSSSAMARRHSELYQRLLQST